MDIDSLLNVHEQDAVKRPVVGQVRAMVDAIAGIEGMQYQTARQTELVTNVTNNATKASADDVLAREAEAAREDADARELRDDDERERLENMNGHAVDPRMFTAATTAGEISALLRDAEAVDPDTLRRAWGYAQPALRALAAKEARTYRQPSASSAFNAWTIWQSKMAGLTRQAPSREMMSDRAARRQREIRDKALEVWRVVGLDHMVARHLSAADIEQRTPTNGGALVKSTLTVGGWFDQLSKK